MGIYHLGLKSHNVSKYNTLAKLRTSRKFKIVTDKATSSFFYSFQCTWRWMKNCVHKEVAANFFNLGKCMISASICYSYMCCLQILEPMSTYLRLYYGFIFKPMDSLWLFVGLFMNGISRHQLSVVGYFAKCFIHSSVLLTTSFSSFPETLGHATVFLCTRPVFLS